MAVVCLESVDDEAERRHLQQRLGKTHTIVDISRQQASAGGGMEVGACLPAGCRCMPLWGPLLANDNLSACSLHSSLRAKGSLPSSTGVPACHVRFACGCAPTQVAAQGGTALELEDVCNQHHCNTHT